ncbi:MAG TPA: tetratricopeptide repeat protein, partial [Rhodocyclaceae bacterium]|nr:tetratricopeptide repeat protein [Rhodocyclaceae bacterium]
LQTLDAPDERTPTPFERAEIHASRGEHEAAAALYAELAKDGDAKARTRLAWMYEAGRGVSRDLDAAARLFMASAQAGDAEAQYAIGVMTMTGRGQPLDPASAREWLQKAAAQNHPAARAALAGDSADR